MATLARLVIGNRRFLLVTMTVVVFLCILAIPKNELNDVFLNYFDPSITFRADSDFTIRNITGLYTIDYSIDSGTPGGINEPAFLTDLESMASWLREQPEVIHVASYSDTISRLNKNLHSDNPDWNRIPESRDLAAQYLLLYELSLPFGLGLNNQISVDKSSLRLTVSTQTLSSNAVIAFNDRVELWVRDHAASVESVTGSGTTLMFANIGHRNITSMLIGTTAALIAVSVLLMFVFRSVKIGIISLIPNLIPAVIGFGLWGLFVGEVGISLSVVTAMTFGIVIDDTIHLLSKYLRARRQLGLNAEQSIRSAYSAVGKALIVTTTVLVAGFGLLATSDFYLNASMGMLTAIIIFSALVADFFMFGPLLMKFESRRRATRVIRESGIS